MESRGSRRSAAVESALRPFGAGTTLPSEAYVSREVLEFELDHCFTRGWVRAGWADGLLDPGQARVMRVGAEPVLVVRDREGSLRTFYNVCRHRGHRLLS